MKLIQRCDAGLLALSPCEAQRNLSWGGRWNRKERGTCLISAMPLDPFPHSEVMKERCLAIKVSITIESQFLHGVSWGLLKSARGPCSGCPTQIASPQLVYPFPTGGKTGCYVSTTLSSRDWKMPCWPLLLTNPWPMEDRHGGAEGPLPPNGAKSEEQFMLQTSGRDQVEASLHCHV